MGRLWSSGVRVERGLSSDPRGSTTGLGRTIWGLDLGWKASFRQNDEAFLGGES